MMHVGNFSPIIGKHANNIFSLDGARIITYTCMECKICFSHLLLHHYDNWNDAILFSNNLLPITIFFPVLSCIRTKYDNTTFWTHSMHSVDYLTAQWLSLASRWFGLKQHSPSSSSTIFPTYFTSVFWS